MAFHQGQRDAGNQIIDKFTKEQPFTVLLAQMQSGKTGTYLFTALEMVRLGLVKHVAIICGSSDTSLRYQARDDLLTAFKCFQRETMLSGDMEGAVRLVDASIGVFFSQDLGKIEDISEDTIIVHDESHMAQSKNNIPFKRFYQKNNLDKALLGDFTQLKEKRCYILGVSATPFSEIVANKKVQTSDWTSEESGFLYGVDLSPKNFCFMMPGEGYIGVTKLLDAECIKFYAENIKTSDCSHFSSVLRKGLPRYHQKYVVVRTMCAEKDSDMMKTIASATGCEYASVFGGEGSLEFMMVRPLKTTIVHICGKFRMGQVVPKNFIAMVYEQSLRPNADTILQGLVGRMCGYNLGGAHTDVDIYVSPFAEELIRKYSSAWQEENMEILTTVTKAMNLGGVKRKNGGVVKKDGFGNEWIMTVPVKFEFKDLETGFSKLKFKRISPIDLINLFEDKPELLAENPDKEEIKKLLDACARVTPASKPSEFYLHHNTKEVKTRNWEEDCKVLDQALNSSKRLNISSYTSSDLKNMNKPEKARFSPISVYGSGKCEGHCYLMGYVRYNPDVHGLIAEELAVVDPKCNYIPGTIQLEDGRELDDVNGGQIIPFSIDTADDPEVLESELEKAILRTQEGHPTYIEGATRGIHSLFDNKSRLYEGIRLDKTIYTEENIISIKQSLDRRLGVNIVFKKSRGRQPKDQIKYSSITW